MVCKKATKLYLCPVIRRLKHILITASLLLMAFFAQQCANAVAPTGGPKDNTPPRVVEAVPVNQSINFSGKKIEITFDEYITLENANQNVLISPPLSEKPDIKLKNKTVVVKFKENLAPNTTYTINFGSAIKDLHEGNLFKDYVYSFSTGDHIDTLAIAGKVLDAADKKPVENAYVGLYAGDRDNLDSLPMTVAPNYITKTDKEGNFRLAGLADKKYLVFAIKDVNSNLYFDQPNEEVAFLDSLVQASCLQKPVPPALDTMANDSLTMQVDTLARVKDSVDFETKTTTMYDQNALNLTLYMFTEVDSTQVLLEKKLVEEGLLRFVFRHPAQDAAIMTPEMLPDSFNLVTRHSVAYDTVWWYFTPNVKDSLWVQVKYDTLINDSTRYSLKFKDKKIRNKKPETLKVRNNLKGRDGLIPGEDLILTFSEPIVRYAMRDSSVFQCDTLIYYDTLAFEQADEQGLKYRLTNPISADYRYGFEVPNSVFFGIRGRTNERIKADFHVLNDDEYGNIYITVVPPKGMKQVIVQLTDESGNVLKEQLVSQKEEVMFDFLMPAKYKLRAILDADGNGKWSTGNYHRHTLPETVIEYKDALDLKAGWDIDLADPWEL